MTTMTCPACQASLEVTHVEDAAPGSHRLPDVADDAPVRALVAGMSGRFAFAELRAAYDANDGWPEITDKALARQLRALGAVPFRTARTRGFIID